jgi:hypothetical protein
MRAGTYAEGRFRRGRASWRARIRWVGLCLLWPICRRRSGCSVCLSSSACGLGRWGRSRSRCRCVRSARRFATGTRRELANRCRRRAQDRLRALGNAQWLVVHDVDAGRGNYDHIVVGRAGVFLIDTKWPAGTLRIENGVPWMTRREYPEAEVRYPQFGPRAKAAAARLSQDLGRRSEQRVWVEPVVVVWSDFPAVIHAEGGCTFIHGSHVVDWLQSRPARLEEAVAAALHDAVRALAAER